jgi:hypothetical protein
MVGFRVGQGGHDGEEHPGRPGGGDSGGRVLERHAAPGSRSESLARCQVEVRRRLALLDLIAGEGAF